MRGHNRSAPLRARIDSAARSAKEAKAAAEAEQEKLKKGLPHLFGFKWYSWAKAFFESRNSMNLLCAANQISKSSTQIRKYIHWATATKLWPTLWPNKTPRMFWVLYPDRDVATIEWYEKIEPEFMPRGEFKNHPVYGWHEEFEKKQIKAIHFNSGVSIYFKSYSQDVHSLQSGTVDAIFCFPGGTLVLTPEGPRPIEEIREGDLVLADHGRFCRVVRTMEREATTVERTFSTGQTVRATPNHPFWTENRGWVQFGDLTPEDQCGTVEGWNQIKNWSSLTARFLRAFHATLTFVAAIISALLTGACSMWPFGRRFMGGESRKGTSSTTPTSTPWTMAWEISRCSRGPSTPESTRKRSGAFAASGNSNASGAGRTSPPEAPRGRLRATARRLVGALGKRLHAADAALLLKRAQILLPSTALGHAPTGARTERVFNLEVEGEHTYFADGFLVHNCDEELPEELYDELKARLFASDGYFHMVFTATRGQLMWWRAIEAKGEDELFADAFKQQVSMFDCMTYADGSPGAYSKEKIKKIIASCKNATEVMRRVYGKFVKESGRVVSEFDPTKHFVKPFKIPSHWHIFSGIDNGSGGESGHPASFAFIAVNPNMREAYVCKGWRGDGVVTTAGDVMEKWEMERGAMKPVQTAYDWAAKDLATIGERMGIPLTKAEKSHDIGWDIVNTLFKFNILRVFDTPELRKFGSEALTVMTETPKRRRKDDLLDAVRYGVCTVPWDWTVVQGLDEEDVLRAKEEKSRQAWTEEDQAEADLRARRGETRRGEEAEEGWDELQDDIDYWNDLYG